MFFLHSFDCFKLCIFNSIASLRALICRFDLFFTKLWTMIFSLNYACFANKFWHEQSIALFIVFCMTRKIMKICAECEIFYDHQFLKAHFLFYFLIICYEIHVKLIHFNSRRIETIIYRVTLNEMLVCNFLIHVRMFKFCQNVCNDIVFCNLWFCLHVDLCSMFDKSFCFEFDLQYFRID